MAQLYLDLLWLIRYTSGLHWTSLSDAALRGLIFIWRNKNG